MKKIILILLVGIFIISFISSSEIPTVEQGETIELIQYCPTCTYVNLSSITFPDNTQQYINDVMTKNGSTYNYSFSNTSQIGEYIYFVEGDKDGSLTGESLIFEVTPTGFILETSESILYIIILIATFILFLGFLYPAIKLPYSNKTNPDGSITRISKAKYLKLLSVWFAYGFFMWFLQTLNAISKSFIKLTYLSNFITNIFTYSQWFSVGITFLILIIIFVEIWNDIILSKTIKRYGKAFLDGRLQ